MKSFFLVLMMAFSFEACGGAQADGTVYAPTVQTITGGPVYVHGYTRANGTYVAPHTRRR